MGAMCMGHRHTTKKGGGNCFLPESDPGVFSGKFQGFLVESRTSINRMFIDSGKSVGF